MTPDQEVIPEKITHYLRHLYDTPATADIHEFLVHSVLYKDKEYHITTFGGTNLFASVDPEVFKKHHEEISRFKEKIIRTFWEIWEIDISNFRIQPDLKKFKILENRVVPVLTPWEQINNDQVRLLEQLRTAVSTMDFQNVGNSCRSILEKLSNEVFDPTIHVAEVDLSPGKYKNRLHTYIKSTINSKNKELRELALSMVNAAEDSVDVGNKVTHDLNASKISAEFCTISTITVISLIKLIFVP